MRATHSANMILLYGWGLPIPRELESCVGIDACHAYYRHMLERRPELDYDIDGVVYKVCLLYTSPSPRDDTGSRMPSSA